MAANAVTGLKETLRMAQETNSSLFYQMRAALELSCWTEDLDFEDYSRLAEVVYAKDFDGVEKLSAELLVAYTAEWEFLGRPETREEWHRAKYGEG